MNGFMKFFRLFTHSHGCAPSLEEDRAVVDEVVESWSSSMSISMKSSGSSMNRRFADV